MTDNSFKWRCVFTTDSLLEAHIVKGLLSQARIDSRVDGEPLLGGIGEIPADQAKLSLMVYEIKVRAAQKILVDYAQKQLTSDWRCNHCTELNGPAFQYCWQCGKQNDQSE
ncbi:MULTISPECIES: DUF2007 domain-containing protein [Pseudoalteromonas]|uniref:RanBP2-type domain-containing protein n=1 Tax=Pseudoalteromonas amylolytica TaxID=1859457 RepID=A0A1S1MY77_9GAMM|nr:MULTISPECIES: DUF2007 domain-containing protein [Pseudoalteromonas]MCF6435886.1 DUF2007 domain-containing protein [Pseudoalteromonas sp. MMG022]OHU89256.1 hypothetical protein BFC16_06360 [Pseudoalteromonas sp. JW3]OHU92156.1 hypothetical protein BET10_07465 [Pseudoalteromonas amylolytica]